MSEYDISLYIDGNVRIIRQPLKLFAEFEASSADIGIFPHTDRNTVSEELATCADFGLADTNVMRAEYTAHAADGFGDNVGLFDSSIIFKNHNQPTSDRCHGALGPVVHSGEELEITLRRSVLLYKQQLPQSALRSKPPLQAMKDWYKLKPEIFRKQPITFRDATGRPKRDYALTLELDHVIGAPKYVSQMF